MEWNAALRLRPNDGQLPHLALSEQAGESRQKFPPSSQDGKRYFCTEQDGVLTALGSRDVPALLCRLLPVSSDSTAVHG